VLLNNLIQYSNIYGNRFTLPILTLALIRVFSSWELIPDLLFIFNIVRFLVFDSLVIKDSNSYPNAF
jgi:hypothetical protein